MGNVYKDLLTLESQKQTKPMELFAAQNKGLETQSSLAKMKYDVVSSAPKGKDADISLLQSLRQKLGAGPMRGWRAAMDGLLTGLEHGAKSHVNAEKMEDARKMIDVFSSFEEVANAAQKRNEWHAKRAQLGEEMTPELEAFTQNMGQLSPYDARKAADGFVDRYNKTMGTDYSVNMIDQHTGNIILKSQSKGDKEINLNDAFPEIGQQKRIKDWEQKAIQTQQEQDARSGQQLNINQQNADMMAGRIDPTKQHDLKLAQEQAKETAKKNAKLSEQNLELEDVSYKIADLKDILNNPENKVITGDTLGAKYDRLIGKQLGTKAYSDTELYDSVSKGLLSFVKGNVAFGNMNLKVFEFLTEKTPGSQKTKAALTRLLDRFEKNLDRQMKRNEKEINSVPTYGTRNTNNGKPQPEPSLDAQIADGLVPSKEEDAAILAGGAGTQNNTQPQVVKMKFPDGNIRVVPLADVESLKQYGKVVG